VGIEENGELRCWLLEVNAFPDFRQTGDELSGMIEGLFEGVVEKAVGGFFGVEIQEGKEDEMVKVLDIDLGRR
jgi:tubulin--tyrosine ligase